MKKNRQVLSRCMGMVLLSLMLGLSSVAQNYKEGILQGTFRVKFKPHLSESLQIESSVTSGIVQTGLADVDVLNTGYSVVNM